MNDHKTVYVEQHEGGEAPPEKIMSETDLPGMEDGSGKRKRNRGRDRDQGPDSDTDTDSDQDRPDARTDSDDDKTDPNDDKTDPNDDHTVRVHKLNTRPTTLSNELNERIRGSLDDDSEDESSSEEDDDDKSMTTNELLAVDPLYFRLNKFLQSDDGHSVANMMQKMIAQMSKLNELIEQKNAVLETKMIDQMAKLNTNMERLVERRSKSSAD